MGCHKLTYHQKTSSKTENTPILEMGGKQGSDYQVFGMQMPGRSFQSDEYRYGFNGMEKDDEISGGGNSYTTQFRQYDPRLGRWKSVDPKRSVMPWETPYSYSNNTPIFGSDPKGDICTPCIQFVIGFTIDIIDQMANELLNGKSFGEAWDEVSLWEATLNGAFSAGNPASLAKKISTSPTIKKLVAEGVEMLADLIQSAVNSYYGEGEVDVYDIIMEAIYGPAYRKMAKTIKKVPTKSLDKKIKSTDNAVNRQKRLVTNNSSDARKTKLKELEVKSDNLKSKKKIINDTKNNIIVRSSKTASKQTIEKIDEGRPTGGSNKQEKQQEGWGEVPTF